MANWLRKMRTWPATIRGKLTISSCCQRPGVVYAVPKTLVVSGFPAPRVERARQRDLGKELNAGPIGVDPDRGPQFVDDPRPSDVVGNQHRAAALADDLQPFAALSAVRPAANPLVGDQRVLGVAAGFGPGGRRSFEVLPPRRLPGRNGSAQGDDAGLRSHARPAGASRGAGSPCAAEWLGSTSKISSAISAG